MKTLPYFLKSLFEILASFTCLLWSAQGGAGSLTATGWPPPNSTIAGYNLYLANASGGQFTKVNSSPITSTAHTIDGVKAGKTYSFRLSQVDLHGVESKPTREWAKVATADTPAESISALHAGNIVDRVNWMKEPEALELSAKTGKPILYDFMALWCGPCKKLAKEVFNEPQNSDWINQEFLAVRIQDERLERADHTNPLRTQELHKKYEIGGFPTLIVDLPGKSFKKMVGYATPPPTRQFLEAALLKLKPVK